MMKNILYITILFAAFCSCTKEIEFDYNDIDPVPVIEGNLTTGNTEIKITKTRNMNDSVKTPGIMADNVTILSSEGEEYVLDFQEDGIYRPSSAIDVRQGVVYTLKVTIDGVEYSASSSVEPTVEISEPKLLWINFVDWMQIMEFESLNVPDNKESYAYARIYRNGEIYWWGQSSFKGNSPFDIGLYYDSEMEMDEEMILHEGDNLVLEFRSVDCGVYTYLSELSSGNMNPSDFFTASKEGKKCLGYFSAYTSVKYEMQYHKTDHE